MNRHLFVSYSRLDGAELADRLFGALTSGEPSFEVWLDRTDIPLGFRFTQELDEAIRDCHSVLYLMTPDSVSGESFCPKEIARADRYKKPILPILGTTGVIPPIELELVQAVDLTSGFDLGVGALKEQLLWIETPAGQLKVAERQRAWLIRSLARVSDADRLRLEEEISRVERRINELKQWLADPAQAAERRGARIRESMEALRQATAMAPGRLSTKFINAKAFVPPLHFQDRHAETNLAIAFLRDSSMRLLTVVGRGGVGKTGMACRLLKAIESGALPNDAGELPVAGIVYLSEQRMRRVSFPHLFEDLAKLLDPASAEKAEAVYRSPQMSTSAKMSALLSLLPPGLVVVLLDNFEELVTTGDHVTRDPELFDALTVWLHAPPNELKMIITTRVAPTDLSMAVPAACREIWLDEGLPSPHAEELLRLLDGDGAVGLRTAPLEKLTEAARRVRGFPRALEALYAVLRNDPNTSLDEVLDKADAALPEKVVEVMVGEAYSRLERHERAVLQALAIYNRPVPAVAVDFLLQPFVPAVETTAVLRWLVDLQIIRKDGDRYYLHPVDAEFSLAQIPEEDATGGVATTGTAGMSRKALLRRAAEYFHEMGKPTDQWNSLTDLEPQLAEFDILCRGERYEEAAQILLRIGFGFLRSWGHVRMLVDLHERLRDTPLEEYTEAHCLGVMGTAYWDTGQLLQATDDFRRCIELTEKRKGPMSGAAWWCNLGCCLRDIGETGEALAAHEKTLDIDRHRGDWSGVGTDLNNIAECYADKGMTDTAIRAVKLAIDAVEFVERSPRAAQRVRGYRLATLSKLQSDAERWAQAASAARESLAIGQEAVNSEVTARAAYYLALAALSQGDLDEAQAAVTQSLQAEYPRFKFRSLLVRGITSLAGGLKPAARDDFILCRKECDELLSRSPQHYLAALHSALALCGLFVCGEDVDLAAAKDLLIGCAVFRQYSGVRSRCIHLLRSIAAHDKTRQIKRLLLMAEDAAEEPATPPADGKDILSHEAVRRLRAAIAPPRASRLQSRGHYNECAEVAAEAATDLDLMSPQQRQELLRPRAWAQARRGFLDGPGILDQIQGEAYRQSLLRVTDYLAVFRFQGLTPAAELQEWFDRGQRLEAENDEDRSGASVLLYEYQGCGLLARGDYAGAERFLQKALTAEKSGLKDVRILARIQASLGETYRLMKDFGQAERHLETAAAFQQEHGIEGDLCEYTLPCLAKLEGAASGGPECLRQARAVAERLDHRKALLRILLLEARLGGEEVEQEAVYSAARLLAKEMPSMEVCPLWARIRDSWHQWCAPAAADEHDFWGL